MMSVLIADNSKIDYIKNINIILNKYDWRNRGIAMFIGWVLQIGE